MGARPPRLLAAIAAALTVISAVVAIGVHVAPAASAASGCVDPPAPPPASDVAGYWMLERNGTVHPFGAASRQTPDDNPGPCKVWVRRAAMLMCPPYRLTLPVTA